MTRIAFTADLHCDDFGSKIDPASGLNARWVDTIRILEWIVQDANQRGAGVLIVGGDFTEARHPAPWRVAQIQRALAGFEGDVVLARGNHDGLRAGASIVDVLAAETQGWSGFSRPGVTLYGDLAIACLPYLDAHWLRAQPAFQSVPEADVLNVLAEQYLTVARGLYVEASVLAARTVLVVHQSLAGGLMSDTQAAFLGDKSLVVDTRVLAAIGFDAILAGHFHRHQVLSADPLIAYAGAPTRTDFGEENQAKGYLIVDLDEAGVRMEFVPTPARRFVTFDGLAGGINDGCEGAIVRVLNLPPETDPGDVRRLLEGAGAFEVTEIRQRARVLGEAVSGMSETLAPTEALAEYFATDPDRERLVGRGRELLAEVA